MLLDNVIPFLYEMRDWMNIQASAYQAQNLTSVKQALNISVLQKVMKQDAQSVDRVIKAMEQSVTPHLGKNLDIKL